jgi:hypothetical protein
MGSELSKLERREPLTEAKGGVAVGGSDFAVWGVPGLYVETSGKEEFAATAVQMTWMAKWR